MLSGCTQDTTKEASQVSSMINTSSSSASSAQNMVANKGFCAVGKVDGGKKTVKVLFSNGEVQTVSFAESAPPKSGEVNAYSKEGTVYRFQETRVFPPLGKVSDTNFEILPQKRQQRYYYNFFYFTDADSSVFVRYSSTSWSVFKGRGVIKNDTKSTCYIYYETELDGLAKVVKYVMVVGGYDEEGQWPGATAESTKFLDEAGNGFTAGDKNLS